MSYSAFIAGCIVQCTLTLFAIVVRKKSAIKQQLSGNNSSTMSTSNRSNNNNIINYRFVLMSIISFTIGLQFKNVYDLMFATSSVGDVNTEGAWAPDDMPEDLSIYRATRPVNTDNSQRFAVTAILKEDNDNNEDKSNLLRVRAE